MRRHRRHLTFLLALSLVVGATACGDDDDEEASPSADAGGEEASGGDEFCDALREFNDEALDLELEDDAPEDDIQAAHDRLDPLLDAVEEHAPDEHDDNLETVRTGVDGLAEGDAETFNDDETSGAFFALLGDAVPDCVEDTAEVTAVDYAFEGVPETFPEGESGIVLANDSDDEEHEFIIFKKADGETRAAEELLNDPASQEEGPGEFSGAVFAGPGDTAGGFLDLSAGDYIAVCFIPVGGGDDGPPHFTEGMFAEFEVA